MILSGGLMVGLAEPETVAYFSKLDRGPFWLSITISEIQLHRCNIKESLAVFGLMNA